MKDSPITVSNNSARSQITSNLPELSVGTDLKPKRKYLNTCILYPQLDNLFNGNRDGSISLEWLNPCAKWKILLSGSMSDLSCSSSISVCLFDVQSKEQEMLCILRSCSQSHIERPSSPHRKSCQSSFLENTAFQDHPNSVQDLLRTVKYVEDCGA
jgi:hypothetical protein